MSTATARAQQQHRAQASDVTIGLIPGDGIGAEVIPAARQVLDALSAHVRDAPTFRYIDLDAGFETFQRTGNALPQVTVDRLRNECTGALFGAVSSPIHKVEGYSSPIVRLRKELDLYANVRPITQPKAWTARGTQAPCDMLIVRENTECLYIKQERLETDPATGLRTAYATRQISERATSRIARLALSMARTRASTRGPTHWWHPRPPTLTVVHKSNVLSVTDGLFREVVRAEHARGGFTDVQVEDQLVDSMVYRVFREPDAFDVALAPNLFGDILSDAAAALAGSLGVVPSANVGDAFVMGEPVHGSAPDIAGKGIANPVAAIRSAGLLLEFLGHAACATRIYEAVDAVIAQGVKTRDMGGSHGTAQVTAAIIRALEEQSSS
ncbi:hypothetical protein BCR44DRAFT_129212 [Catenaria anguillulae PL171]|uniref:Isopropylmalate dehydrogenase-like domain-containing protein n=1 Tax=Catenaria anguillulae PL171 TaxID=765915 RepID=A0A1Y2I0J9_9FUNG|nr:hypothetical protein BCR44DRAFT_129212 [Catenaria anguillulae PL171]